MVYRHTISDNDQLKRMLIDCLAQLSQDTLNHAIDQLLTVTTSSIIYCFIKHRLTQVHLENGR